MLAIAAALVNLLAICSCEISHHLGQGRPVLVPAHFLQHTGAAYAPECAPCYDIPQVSNCEQHASLQHQDHQTLDQGSGHASSYQTLQNFFGGLGGGGSQQSQQNYQGRQTYQSQQGYQSQQSYQGPQSQQSYQGQQDHQDSEESHHGKDHNIHYKFEYAVNSQKTGDVKRQTEERQGDVVRGEYSLLEEDGNVRTVKYYADWKTGFHAQILNSKRGALG